MTDQSMGVTSTPVATGTATTGSVSTTVATPVTQTPGATPAVVTPATPPTEEMRTVPISVLKTVESKLKEANEKNKGFESQLAQYNMMQRMAPQTPVTPQTPTTATPTDPFTGMQDADLLTVQDVKKLLSTLPKPDVTQVVMPLAEQISKLQVQIQDPDYEKTIRTYLPDVFQTHPNPQFLAAMIERSPNKLLAALSFAKLSPKYQQEKNQAQPPAVPQNDPLDMLSKIIANATAPASPGVVGGGGATVGVDRFRNMTDAEFAAEMERVKNGVR